MLHTGSFRWIEDTPCTLYVAIAGMYSCVTAHSSNVVIPHYDTWHHTEAAKTPQPACIPTALESEHLHCFQCITLDLLTPHCDITATSKHTHSGLQNVNSLFPEIGMKHFWGHLQHLQKWSTVTSVVFCLLLYYSFKVHMPLFVITFFPVAGHRSWQRLQIATTWLVIGHLGEVGCCECFQIWEKCKYGSYFFLQLIVHAQSVALQWHILLKNENSNHDVIYCTELQTHWHLKCHLQSDTYHDITQIINILVFLLFRHALSVFGECSIYKYRCSMFSWTNWRKVDVDFQESVSTSYCN